MQLAWFQGVMVSSLGNELGRCGAWAWHYAFLQCVVVSLLGQPLVAWSLINP